MKLVFPIIDEGRISKPYILAGIGAGRVRCMIDSGANIPVWCAGEALFSKYFPEAVFFKKTYIGGFGKTPEAAPIYAVERFILSDPEARMMRFRKFKIAVIDRPEISCQLILCITLFAKMRTVFDLESRDPVITISAAREEYTVGIYQDTDSIFAFYEDDA